MADILLINDSKLIMAEDIAAFIPAMNRHLAGDFGPFWGLAGTVYFGEGPQDAWQFYLQDGLDQSGDLAYHTDENGNPIARIDVQACRMANTDWRIATGHEIDEALVDPTCVLFGADGTTLRECIDPVEETQYEIDGIPMTNFTTPRYWGLRTTIDGRYDFNKELTGPCPLLLPGGYSTQWTGGKYVSKFGDRARAMPGFMASRANGRRAWGKKRKLERE